MITTTMMTTTTMTMMMMTTTRTTMMMLMMTMTMTMTTTTTTISNNSESLITMHLEQNIYSFSTRLSLLCTDSGRQVPDCFRSMQAWQVQGDNLPGYVRL
jgi:hypothetical protein